MAKGTLNEQQVKDYEEQGYLKGLPVFYEHEVIELNKGYQELAKLLKPGEKHTAMNGWHNTSKWLYDIATDNRILDYVESLLGPDFYLWGTHFFSKEPHSKDSVTWHQDAYYWPLSPHRTVTVWLAFLDSNEDNGAMQVIPGTHTKGMMKHRNSTDDTNLLDLELEEGTFSERDAVILSLKRGEISIHDDAIVHGSKANRSDQWRIGLTMRFSTPEVKCDLSVWPSFCCHMVRGVDRHGYNKIASIPIERFARYDPDNN